MPGADPACDRHARRSPARELELFSFNGAGQFVRLPPLAIEDAGSWGRLVARGARAFMSSRGALTVADTRDPAEPTLTRHDLRGWGCDSPEVAGDRAFCALGPFGVFSVDL